MKARAERRQREFQNSSADSLPFQPPFTTRTNGSLDTDRGGTSHPCSGQEDRIQTLHHVHFRPEQDGISNRHLLGWFVFYSQDDRSSNKHRATSCFLCGQDGRMNGTLGRMKRSQPTNTAPALRSPESTCDPNTGACKVC